MGKSKELFIQLREIELGIEECNGNCMDCIRSCDITQTDIDEYIKQNKTEEEQL